jgi:hypothetical protein
VGAVTLLEPFNGFDNGFGLQDHAGPAAERSVIDGSVPIAGEVTEVHDAGLDEPARTCDTQDACIEVGLDGIGEECEDGKEQRFAR